MDGHLPHLVVVGRAGFDTSGAQRPVIIWLFRSWLLSRAEITTGIIPLRLTTGFNKTLVKAVRIGVPNGSCDKMARSFSHQSDCGLGDILDVFIAICVSGTMNAIQKGLKGHLAVLLQPPNHKFRILRR